MIFALSKLLRKCKLHSTDQMIILADIFYITIWWQL